MEIKGQSRGEITPEEITLQQVNEERGKTILRGLVKLMHSSMNAYQFGVAVRKLFCETMEFDRALFAADMQMPEFKQEYGAIPPIPTAADCIKELKETGSLSVEDAVNTGLIPAPEGFHARKPTPLPPRPDGTPRIKQ